jgi:hypothetical protein
MPDRDFVQERQETFEILSNYCNKPPEVVITNDYDEARQSIIVQATLPENFSEDDWFVKTKQELNKLADRRAGIISTYSFLKNKADQNIPVYIRDAREQEKNRPTNLETAAFENWAIMGLSAFQIAYEIVLNNFDLSPTDFQAKAEKIKEHAKNFLESIANQEHPQAFAFLTVKNVLAPIVKDYLHLKSNEEAEKVIYQLKDFGNLDEPPYALVTISKTTETDETTKNETSKEFAQIDVPLYQLTEVQQLDYIKILLHKNQKELIPVHLSNLTIKAVLDLRQNGLPAWYETIKNKHSELMVLHYIPQILAGRQIPTQMLVFLPGMRNAGEERIYELGEQRPKQKMQSFHAGSMGQDTNANFEENVRLTAENMKQFQELTGVQKVRVNSWISPWFVSVFSRIGIANESRLYQVQQAAAAKINADETAGFKVTYANTPLEFTRAFLSSDRTIENEIWKDAIEKLSQYTGEKTTLIEKLINDAVNKYPEGVPLIVANKIVDPGLHNERENHEQSNEIEAKLQEAEDNTSDENELKGKISAILDDYKHVNLATRKKAMTNFIMNMPRRSVGLKKALISLPQPSEPAVQLFQHMVELQRLRTTTKSLFTFGLQKNAQRAAKYKQMQSLVNELEGKPTSALITGCKSGKDREGLLAILIMIDVVVSAFKRMSTQLAKIGSKVGIVESNIAKNVVEAEHITTRAGGQGGTEGARGIKNEGRVLPTWLKSLFALIAKKEASSNKKIKKEKLTKEEIAIVKGTTISSDLLVAEALTSRQRMVFSEEDRIGLAEAHVIGPSKDNGEQLPHAAPVPHVAPVDVEEEALNAEGLFGHGHDGSGGNEHIDNNTNWKTYPNH